MKEEQLIEVRLNSRMVFDGELLKVRSDEVAFPNGNHGVREWIAHPGATAVIALTPQRTVFMVEQYRYPLQRVTLELPAGKIDPGEPLEVCALRELREETGLSAETIRKIGAFATTPAFTDEIIHLYLAQGLSRHEASTDPDEFLTALELPVEEVLQKIINGEIMDAKTIIAMLMAERQGLLGLPEEEAR